MRLEINLESIRHFWKDVILNKDLQGGAVVKNPTCQCRRWGFEPWSGISPGEGNGNSFQYSCLENSMDRGASVATVHRVTKSQTEMSVHVHTCVCTHIHVHTHTWKSNIIFLKICFHYLFGCTQTSVLVAAGRIFDLCCCMWDL